MPREAVSSGGWNHGSVRSRPNRDEGACVLEGASRGMISIDRFSFITGLILGLILAWALSLVWGWLKGAFKPPGDKPLGQKVASSIRKLAASLLVLLTLAAAAYIVYTFVFR